MMWPLAECMDPPVSVLNRTKVVRSTYSLFCIMYRVRLQTSKSAVLWAVTIPSGNIALRHMSSAPSVARSVEIKRLVDQKVILTTLALTRALFL